MVQANPAGGEKPQGEIPRCVLEMGDFLNKYAWDLFCTFTFRDREIPGVRRKLAQTSSAIERIRPWLRYVTKGYPHRAFVAEEHHSDGERLHLHALVWVDRPVNCYHAYRWWFKRHGRATVSKYDPKKRASWYCAKYVAKEILESGRWVLYGSWPKMLTQAVVDGLGIEDKDIRLGIL